MKKRFLSFRFFFGYFILFFSSCIDHNYDLTDKNIDKNIVLSPDGINIPVGNLDTIFIFEKIGYDGIKENADGSLYVEYSGRFHQEQFVVPHYDIPDIKVIETGSMPIDISGFDHDVILLLEEQILTYEITKPEFDADSNWQIDPKQINFNYFTIHISFDLKGFSNVKGSAKLKLYLRFPPDFQIQGEILDKGRVVREVIFNKENPNTTYTLQEIYVESYIYQANGEKESSLVYDLELVDISTDFSGDVNNPSFQMAFTTDNDRIDIKSILGKLTGNVSVQGEIGEFEELKSSIGENALLQFENPSMLFSLKTNLGADFQIAINKLNANDDHPLSTGSNPLLFEKPAITGASKTTAYYLAPDTTRGKPQEAIGKKLAINNLFTTIPQKINYDLEMQVNEQNASVLYNDLILEGDYKFMLPFSFDSINVNIKAPPIALGEGDVYEQFLKNVKEKISIVAETVSIGRSERLRLEATVRLLDAEQRIIQGTNIHTPVENGKSLSIDILKADLEKAKDARYIRFDFLLQGSKVSLTKNDYINIRALRFVSDGGSHYELDI